MWRRGGAYDSALPALWKQITRSAGAAGRAPRAAAGEGSLNASGSLMAAAAAAGVAEGMRG